MADDQHTIEIQLHANMVEINAALDGHHKVKFLLLARRRRDLNAKLARITSIPKPAEVPHGQ